jgi:hypothetical protein
MPFCALASPVNASAFWDGGDRMKCLDTYIYKLSPSWPVSPLLYFLGAIFVSLPAEPKFPTLRQSTELLTVEIMGIDKS